MTGRIFDIQRFSIHDGPGIRTTVFLKGCPLACKWCHNPEGIARGPHLSFLPDKCIGCGYCFRVCPRGAHAVVDGAHVLGRGRCEVCGRCAAECYAGAIELIGRDVSVQDVMKEVLADKPFYHTSGGGMTLSGGEPLSQIDFSVALLEHAKDQGLHNCIETSSQAPWSSFERVLGLVDLFLCDIKDIDARRHAELTGVSNEVILANLRRLHETGATMLLRVPLVGGCNDMDDNLAGIAALAAELDGIEGVEIMKYHRLGTSKHARLGTVDPMADNPATQGDGRFEHWVRTLRGRGVKVNEE